MLRYGTFCLPLFSPDLDTFRVETDCYKWAKFIQFRVAIWRTITEAGVVSADYQPFPFMTFADDVALVVLAVRLCHPIVPGDLGTL